MYSVVEFENGEVSYIPTEWIFKNGKKCYWPNQKNKINIYREECFPAKESWETHNLKRIFCSLSKLTFFFLYQPRLF